MITRYFSKKNSDGIFFAKEPKDYKEGDYPVAPQPREWTFGNDSGVSMGWEQEELRGLVESAWIDNSEYGDRFCIGLQHDNGVDVLQIDLTKKDAMHPDLRTFAKKAANIDLDNQLVLKAWKNEKAAWKTQDGKTVTPCYLTVSEPEGRKDKSVPPVFEYKEGEGYVGLPAPKETTKLGKTVRDYSEMDEALFAEIEKFVARVEKECAGRKSQRPQTKAEGQRELGDSIEEPVDESQVPF